MRERPSDSHLTFSYPYRLALYQIDQMRVDGIFRGKDGSIPEGQAILNAHLAEAHEIVQVRLTLPAEADGSAVAAGGDGARRCMTARSAHCTHASSQFASSLSPLVSSTSRRGDSLDRFARFAFRVPLGSLARLHRLKPAQSVRPPCAAQLPMHFDVPEVLERIVASLRVDDAALKSAVVGDHGVELDAACAEHDCRLDSLFRLSLVCRQLARIVRREIEHGGVVEASRLPRGDDVGAGTLRIGSLAVCLDSPWPSCVALGSIRDLLFHGRESGGEAGADEDDVVAFERRWNALVSLRSVTVGVDRRDERITLLMPSLPSGVRLSSLATMWATPGFLRLAGAAASEVHDLRLRLAETVLGVDLVNQTDNIAKYLISTAAHLRVLHVLNLDDTECSELVRLVGQADGPFSRLEHLVIAEHSFLDLPLAVWQAWRDHWPACLRSLDLTHVEVDGKDADALDAALAGRTAAAAHRFARLTMCTSQDAETAAAAQLADVCRRHDVNLDLRCGELTSVDAMRFDTPA